jgi:hypothetical protein
MLLWEVGVIVGAINVVSRLHKALDGEFSTKQGDLHDPKLRGNDSL